MESYFINMNQMNNPGLHHEVHKTTCQWGQNVPMNQRKNLGYCSDEVEAVAKGKNYYSNADGCATCCPKAHRG